MRDNRFFVIILASTSLNFEVVQFLLTSCLLVETLLGGLLTTCQKKKAAPHYLVFMVQWS